MRGEILTKMVTSFDRMLFVLEEWSSFRAWVINYMAYGQQNRRRTIEKIVAAVKVDAGRQWRQGHYATASCK